MNNLAAKLAAIPEQRGDAPWAGYEYVRGWGVFGLPFDSGHVLALRVFPQNSFAPYRTVWHRDPAGRWSIYVDAPRMDIACPRYYGPACAYTGFAHVDVAWTGPRSLRVTVDGPALEWTLEATRTPALALLNPVGAAFPTWSWRAQSLVRVRELLARSLGMGRLSLRGETPSGHDGTLMPKRMYVVERSRATLAGTDLGSPVRLHENPMIGDVPLPARGVLAVGGGMWRIRDQAEFDRTRAACAQPATA